jgi:hypothetical protein
VRRLLSSLLLSLCLVIVQEGALLHALAHDREGVGQPADDDIAQPGDDVCLTCLALADLAGAMAPTVATPLLLALDFNWSAVPRPGSRTPEPPRASSRGPPASRQLFDSLSFAPGFATGPATPFGDQKKV